MNRPENLGRDLAIWFADTAAPRVPDFTDDILRVTAGTRQRPRWSFLERWLPMSVIALGRRTVKPLPWRTIGLLVVLALLLAAVAAYVGSRQRLPAPFGLAANGLVAYVSNGDIYTVDPNTGERRAIATGPDTDREPRWSLDGTHLAFLRASNAGDVLVIADPARPGDLVSTEPFVELDTDSIKWAPDGRSIAVSAQLGTGKATYIVDRTTGDGTPLGPDMRDSDVYWRPPDGRQMMLFGGSWPDFHLYLMTMADGTRTEISLPDGPGSRLRMSGWSPDGQTFMYMRGDPDTIPFRTHVLDLSTGNETVIEAAFGHVSNDGTRMVAFDLQDQMCVLSLSGGPCIPIGDASQRYDPAHAAGVYWSPDDEWILSRPESDGSAPTDSNAVLLDPNGGTLDQPSWLAEGGESIQRLAP